MSGIVGKNVGRGSGVVTATPVGADAVSGSNIADDAIDSEHYTDGSIDNAHIADDAIDSEHYADGSIDNAHIADDAIDSEHYADGSIDLAHMSSESVDEDNLHISNSGSNGNFLSKQSGDAGGLTWAAAGGGGKVVQVVNVTEGELASGTTVHPLDDTIAQKTEGNEFLTLAITPTSDTNKLIIECQITAAYNIGNREAMMSLFQDTTANALTTSIGQWNIANVVARLTLKHYMISDTDSSTTFKIRVGGYSAGTVSMNGFGASPARTSGGLCNSSLTITEIEA